MQLGGSAVEPLISHVTGNTDSLQYIAAQILGQIGDRRADPFLKELLRDDNHYVREQAVRALGQLTTADGVEIGDDVEPVYEDELRDPEAGIREPDSQAWDGYRFEPA